LRHFLAALLLTIPGARASICQGCSVPVFRYALDHWHADNFRLELSARDAADPEVTRFARNLGANSGLNLEVRRLAAETEGTSRLLRPAHGNAEPTQLWDGAVTGQTLSTLTDSPLRREIVARLLRGDSAVWILVEGTDRGANEATSALLEKRLRYLEQVVRLPDIDPNDPSSKIGPGPALKVAFSRLNLSQKAEGEAPLRAMLAGPRSGLERSEQTWIAAVFGRGRVLGAWPASEMDDAAIEEVALFLVGACSCQVKRQNPGWDLLLQFDWDEKLADLGIPQLTGASPKDSGGNVIPSPDSPAASAPAPSPSPAVADVSAPPELPKADSVIIRLSQPEKHPPKKREGLPVPAILVGLTLIFLFAGKYRRSSE
jgi:hypothetical protein